MEGEHNILDAVFEDEDFEDGEDVEMFDVEEGELVEEGKLVEFNSQNGSGQNSGGNVSVANQERQGKNQKRKGKKKRNRRRNSGPGINVTDIDRFVMDTCRRLKERKSYLVYTAVGCLGVLALNDLVKEVDAIQACGGQMTHDGKRFRFGGGVLWSIVKAREPKAYKEIMKKGREFEKQFRPTKNRQPIQPGKEGSSQAIVNSSKDDIPANVSDAVPVLCQMQTQGIQSNSEQKHLSVHDRLRVPVSYDDDLLGEAPKDDALEC